MAADVSTSLPDIDLPPLTTITVTVDDANARITKLNVYGYTPEREQETTSEEFVPLFTYGPASGAVAP